MPELPEVNTIVKQLHETILAKTVTDIQEMRPGTVRRLANVHRIGKIISVGRRGKFIIIQTDKAIQLTIHLRMTGKLIYDTGGNITSHCRANIFFKDGTTLLFNDVRTFGSITLHRIEQKLPELAVLGVEPLSSDFDHEFLLEACRKSSRPIKNLLLDQRIVAGLGNIYVSEILHRSGILPARASSSISSIEANKLVLRTKQVLSEAIKKNGTSISDYRRIDGKTGEYQNFLRVYGKDKCRCGAQIDKIKLAGRSSYYCPDCQH
jgi:formamidopyrimidine-DNA glycosylase